ncbi:18305_t:CDS:2 [Acaulospora morrowiae]|uniref:18305_t:CDS:1 n=1 Tax=Acaulospora morrowiae TaxID=94023 RepID=A0A9N9B5J0_9GLOM|nr:18305_t:CDS:2 [Acaulospora morrowiae]
MCKGSGFNDKVQPKISNTITQSFQSEETLIMTRDDQKIVNNTEKNTVALSKSMPCEPNSSIEPYSIMSDLNMYSDQEPIISHDNIQNRQNEQIEITLVKEPDVLIMNKELSITATTQKNQDRTNKIENNQETKKELAREFSEDQ